MLELCDNVAFINYRDVVALGMNLNFGAETFQSTSPVANLMRPALIYWGSIFMKISFQDKSMNRLFWNSEKHAHMQYCHKAVALYNDLNDY